VGNVQNLGGWLTTVVSRVCLDHLRARKARREESLEARLPDPFVLHDMFAVPFTEIAPIVQRSPDATKMLASRARRRVQDARTVPDADLARQHAAVDAFLTAARGGDFDALLAVLDPDVVLRSATADGVTLVRGATAVASGAVTFQRLAPLSRPVLVNGAAGLVVDLDGELYSVLAFTVVEGRIVEIDILADRDQLRSLGIPGAAAE